jgi:hypothetical protein
VVRRTLALTTDNVKHHDLVWVADTRQQVFDFLMKDCGRKNFQDEKFFVLQIILSI